MLEELLELGTIFDWISPTLSIAQDLANGPSHTFLIPQDCGWTGMEIAHLLRRRGIKTWGHMIVNGTFMITVRQPQGRPHHPEGGRPGHPAGPTPAAWATCSRRLGISACDKATSSVRPRPSAKIPPGH